MAALGEVDCFDFFFAASGGRLVRERSSFRVSWQIDLLMVDWRDRTFLGYVLLTKG